jgi:MoaA/NifB/PqqE/SkfB family radical SAM enzyme
MNGFDQSIRGFCRDAARVSRRDPGLAYHFARTALRQRQAAARRRRWAKQGVQVPPLMIMSITRQCNLRCAGCFVHAQGRPTGIELTTAELRTVLADARDLGVSIVTLAGGEPLTRPEILDVAAEFPELLFPLVTNGSLLDDAMLSKLEMLRNVIPVISLEGLELETNARRGSGVYQRALDAMDRMRERRIFFGTSVMITRRNFGLVTSRRFVRSLVDRGARLFFYVDYVPIKAGTEYLVPSDTQRGLEPFTMMQLRTEFPAIFVASAASESAFGGCMAAGEGFVHVSAEGDLEPCPFSPFSDTNLRRVPLRVALQSPLLRSIRESGEHLSEAEGGCALWARRDWVRSMMASPAGEPAAPVAPGPAAAPGDAPVPVSIPAAPGTTMASPEADSEIQPCCDRDEIRRAA